MEVGWIAEPVRGGQLLQRVTVSDYISVRNKPLALAHVALWIEHRLVNQKATSSIPSQGTCLGCGSGPRWGMREKQPHIDVSLPLFLLPFPSL